MKYEEAIGLFGEEAVDAAFEKTKTKGCVGTRDGVLRTFLAFDTFVPEGWERVLSKDTGFIGE